MSDTVTAILVFVGVTTNLAATYMANARAERWKRYATDLEGMLRESERGYHTLVMQWDPEARQDEAAQ